MAMLLGLNSGRAVGGRGLSSIRVPLEFNA